MSVELARTINDLDESFPRARDLIKEGDDHIRLLKSTLKGTFPGITGVMNVSHEYLNTLPGLVNFNNNFFNLNTSLYVNGARNIDVGGNRIQNVANPITDQDVVTLSTLKQLLWPIGAIFITVDDRNPAFTFGFGTWERFSSGRVLMGAGESVDAVNQFRTFAVGETGGSYSHKLTEPQMPSHSHSLTSASTSPAGNHTHGVWVGEPDVLKRADGGGPMEMSRGTGWRESKTSGLHSHNVSGNTDATGGSEAFPIMQPWIACSMWRRTA